MNTLTMTEEEIRNGLTLHGLSIDAVDLLLKWKIKGAHQPIHKPTWDEFFLGLAEDIKTKSADAQTANGAVIVNDDHHILGVGYNGFMSGIDDQWLPNIRPDKYPWMLHAELNAILNCEHKPKGCIIYVTGHPCLHCFQCIKQVGIREIVYNSNSNINMLTPEMMTLLEIAKWLARDKVKVRDHYYKHEDK